MRFGKIVFSIAILCICVLTLPVNAAKNDYMPKGLQKIKLGMTESDLKAVRPRAEIFTLGKPTKEDEMKYYGDTIPELTFLGDEVFYGFYQGKLSIINMYDISTLEKCKVRRQQIIRGAINRWGNYRLMVDYVQAGQPARDGGKITKTSRSPKLVWKVGEIEIILPFNLSCRYDKSPYNGECDKYMVALIIMNKKLFPSADEFVSVVPATADEMKSISNELKNNTEPPYFE